MVKGFTHESIRSKMMFLGSELTFETLYVERIPMVYIYVSRAFLITFHQMTTRRWVLLKYISPDQLPEAYGGTRCEPDPYCTKYVSLANSSIDMMYAAIYIVDL